VELWPRSTWQGWDGDGALLVLGPGGPERLHPDITVLALGGASWPRVGSNGAWVPALEAAGVAVTPLRPANCGFVVGWSPVFTGRYAGGSLKNVRLSFGGNSVRGDTTITTDGIEGGAVHVLSAALRDEVAATGSAVLEVDLHPDLTVDSLRQRLARGRAKDSLSTVLKRAGGLQPIAVGLVREAAGNRLPREPAELARAVKEVRIHVVAAQPLERAISTAGGVALDELDASFMLRSRSGTYVVGEMLDWEAPTGGYLLQATFSTAVRAATAAAASVGARVGDHAGEGRRGR